MPKFKKAVRKADGGSFGSTPMRFPDQEARTREEQLAGLFGRGVTGLARGLIYAMGGDPDLPTRTTAGSSVSELPTRSLPLLTSGMRVSMPTPGQVRNAKKNPSTSLPGPTALQPKQVPPQGRQASMADLGLSGISSMLSGAPATDPLAGPPPSSGLDPRNAMYDYDTQPASSSLKDMSKIFRQAAKAPTASPEMAKAAGEIPKTKAGMKKFMQDYGKFIALGAMAGAGGKGGQIAAPIIAALPGLIEMMRGKKSAPTASSVKTSAPGTQMGMSSGGSVKYKSGGAIRKFKGGSMDKSKGNTKDSMLTPKYKKGGSIGEIPQHKKMAMGKPTPQSTGQKFAKGGTMKCATGGGVKGYGIAKKIRPTGPMN